MKHLRRALYVVLVSAAISISGYTPPEAIYNVLYTIAGIFFSIGYSVVIGFDYGGVTNEKTLKWLKDGLLRIERTFIAYFIVGSALFFASSLKAPVFTWWKIKFSLPVFLVVGQAYIIAYFVFNFRSLLSLKHELFERIAKERKKAEERKMLDENSQSPT